MEKIIFRVVAVILLAFVILLIYQSKQNVIPIFATIALIVAALGGVDYDDY